MYKENNTEQSTMVLRDHNDQISGHPEQLLRKKADGFLRVVKFNSSNQRLFNFFKIGGLRITFILDNEL